MAKKIKYLIIFISVICFFNTGFGESSYTVKSPNGKIAVTFSITPEGIPVYTVSYSGAVVLRQSKLGIVRSDADFSKDLKLISASDEKQVSENYKMLYGKRLDRRYAGNRRVFHMKNKNDESIDIIFQVSDDGAAFRYYFPGKSDNTFNIIKETSSFHFDTAAKAFIEPCQDSRTGWNSTQPSYEENYKEGIPVGTTAPYKAGWVMPALFHEGNIWICLTETAVDTNYCGSRLSQLSPDGEYSIQFPESTECRAGEPVLPESTLPWFTPWRVIAISNGLKGLVESTLETDLANPAKYDVSSWLQPGISSWSWVIYKDTATTYYTQKKFIDFASSMDWKYCLIDAYWDKQIGYEKIKELADYAKTKKVRLLLWYNSAGDWNTTPLTPRDKMLTHASRTAEFKKLEDMGIAGIKVDFFGGDGQSFMKYYIDILKDAAQYKLAVNFHGATFPRGWERTYPNLVSMEAVKGEEYVTFDQPDADAQPSHCATLPFTRNLFDPMDFTPVNFSGIPNIQRRTTGGFEIALSVIFTSGIQHIAEVPKGMAEQKDFVIDYMKSLPVSWDDTKFIDGYPGKYVVLARKKGAHWYIAGINGEDSVRRVTLKVPFVKSAGNGIMITDSSSTGNFIEKSIDLSKPVEIHMNPYGGFVIKTGK